jgi:hypothetical protein
MMRGESGSPSRQICRDLRLIGFSSRPPSMAWSADWCRVCHGARFGEGPVLASLAMLALKNALRVAPGGSALLFPCAVLHGLDDPGRDGKAGSPIEPASWFGTIAAWIGETVTRSRQLLSDPASTYDYSGSARWR